MASISLSEGLDVLQAAATLLALILGGLWTALLFFQRRERFPRARVGIGVTQANLDSERVLLHIDLKVENVGTSLLSIQSVDLWICQVLPVDDGVDLSRVPDNVTEFQWPQIGIQELKWTPGQFEIESGEMDERAFDFVVDTNVRLVRIYGYVRNANKKGREIGWRVVRYEEIRGEE